MNRKLGLKALGLGFMAALMISAFVASSAQAEVVNADWLVLNGTTHELVTTAVPVEVEQDTMTTLSTTFGASNTPVKLLCNKVKLANSNLEANGKASGKIEFSENCETFLNGVLSAVCAPTEPIIAEFKAQAQGDGTEHFILFEPKVAGEPFAKIKFGNEECLLAPSQQVSGSVLVEDCNHDALSFLLRHLIQEKAVQGTGHGLKFGTAGKAAKLEGSIWVRLTSDKEWKLMLEGEA